MTAKNYCITDGSSALWPEVNFYFLSLQGIPEHVVAGSNTQIIYKELLTGFDSITSCEVKDFYKFKLFLQGLDDKETARPELCLLIQAFLKWVSFDYEKARSLLRQHIFIFPTDVVAIFFIHMLDFCTGKTTELLSDLDYCDRYINESHQLYSFYLSIKSFVLCENKRYEEALTVGLQSIRICPNNIYGIHAVAHALHEKNSWADLCRVLDGCKENWIHNVGMRMHIYWHLAIAYEKNNKIEKSISTFRKLYALKESPFAKQDLDAVGFLWRLKLKFFEDKQFDPIWQNLAVLWGGGISSSTSYFHKLHAALAFAAAKQPLLIEKLIAESDGFGIDIATHKIGRKVLESILHFAMERYEDCYLALRGCQDKWALLGGSRAQRELLSLTMNASARMSEITVCA